MFQPLDQRKISTTIDESFEAFDRFDFIDGHTLLTTEGYHVVSIYDTRTGTAVKSWTFPELEKLSCPVVYDRNRNYIVAVVGYRQIRMFTALQEYEDGERHKFSKRISFILSNPFGEPVVVFEDGDIKFLNNAIANKTVTESAPRIYNVHKKSEDLVSARLIPLDKSLELVTVSRNSQGLLNYTRLEIVRTTQSVSLLESYTLSEKFSGMSIDAETGKLIGVTSSGTVMVLDEGLVEKIYQMEEAFEEIRSVFFFPKCHCNVIGIVYLPKQSKAVVMDVVDVRYGIHERQSLALPPLTSGITFSSASGDTRMLISSSRGICIQSFSISSVSLFSMMTPSKENKDISDCERMQIESLEGSVIRRLESLLKSGTTTQHIISSIAEVNTTPGSHFTEDILAKVLCHLLEKDCSLKEKTSDHLMHVILTTVKFNPSMLTKELKTCTGSLVNPIDRVLAMSSSLLDLLNEEDDKAVAVTDLISSLLDSHFLAILGSLDSRSAEIGDALNNLLEKVDQICCYYTVASQLKSFIESLISGVMKPTRKKIKTNHGAMSVRNQLPDYCVETIYI